MEFLKTFHILKVSFHFDICGFVRTRSLGGFVSRTMCYILGKKASTITKFRHNMQHAIFCSQKSFVDFAGFVPGILKRTHPKIEQNRRSASGPPHLNPMEILKNVLRQEFLKDIFQQLYGFYFLNA